MSTTELSKSKILINEKDHVQGSENATITLLEYGDYQCEECGLAYPIIKRIQEKLGDKLRFVFRSFPLSEVHDYAMHASEAAEIAGQQGKYWEMHDLLFNNQDNLDDDSLARNAKRLGLDVKRFKHDLDYDIFEDAVEETFVGGMESGVNGAPTFFINGVRYDGDLDYDSLLKKLEHAG